MTILRRARAPTFATRCPAFSRAFTTTHAQGQVPLRAMPRKRDVLYDLSLMAASASTAIAVYWGLLQLQRKYWRYRGKAKARIPLVLLQSEWSQEIQLATEAALLAGRNIKLHTEKETKNVQYKGDIDLVTETDKANEKLVMDMLKAKFPTHLFIGEEEASALGSIPALTAAPTWIIDPIDGTTNFVHGFPFSCVAIALAVGKEVVAGIVYDPAKDELFLAAKGKGAYCNGKRLKTTATAELAKAVVIQEFGYERTGAGIAKLLAATDRLLKANVQAVRQLGSGVLDLAYVACGRVDAVYCGVAGEGWKPWDYAAGSILATEAGGVMTNLRGEDFDLYDTSMICAANEALARKIVGIAGGGRS